eukprot:s1201_g18.t1
MLQRSIEEQRWFCAKDTHKVKKEKKNRPPSDFDLRNSSISELSELPGPRPLANYWLKHMGKFIKYAG